jgi:hypothetical protein
MARFGSLVSGTGKLGAMSGSPAAGRRRRKVIAGKTSGGSIEMVSGTNIGATGITGSTIATTIAGELRLLLWLEKDLKASGQDAGCESIEALV